MAPTQYKGFPDNLVHPCCFSSTPPFKSQPLTPPPSHILTNAKLKAGPEPSLRDVLPFIIRMIWHLLVLSLLGYHKNENTCKELKSWRALRILSRLTWCETHQIKALCVDGVEEKETSQIFHGLGSRWCCWHLESQWVPAVSTRRGGQLGILFAGVALRCVYCFLKSFKNIPLCNDLIWVESAKFSPMQHRQVTGLRF